MYLVFSGSQHSQPYVTATYADHRQTAAKAQGWQVCLVFYWGICGGSLSTTEEASHLLLERWPSRKHSLKSFVLQLFSWQSWGTSDIKLQKEKDSVVNHNWKILSFERKAYSKVQVFGMVQRPTVHHPSILSAGCSFIPFPATPSVSSLGQRRDHKGFLSLRHFPLTSPERRAVYSLYILPVDMGLSHPLVLEMKELMVQLLLKWGVLKYSLILTVAKNYVGYRLSREGYSVVFLDENKWRNARRR